MGKQLLVRLPDDVGSDLEEIVPARGRTAFIVEAVREKLQRLRAQRALERVAGLLKPEDYPEFSSSESIVAWVDRLRLADTRWTESGGKEC